MGQSQRVFQQRSVSQQQQDFCGLVREKVIIVLLVVLSAQLSRDNLFLIFYHFARQTGIPYKPSRELVCTVNVVAVTSNQ